MKNLITKPSNIFYLILNRPTPYLILFTFFGTIFRFMAWNFNDIPHGDIHLDYAAAWGFVKYHKLVLPFIAPRYNAVKQFEYYYPLDQHMPLWPLLGGITTLLNGYNVYSNFKILTLIFGTMLIPCSYWAFRKTFGDKSALLASTFIAFSYILIDYSGNGSLYILHALLFVLIILFVDTSKMGNSIIIGGLIGFAYLLNYQAIITLIAMVIIYIFRYAFDKHKIKNVYTLVLSMMTLIILITPWFIRNYLVFDDPFYNVNIEYLKTKLDITSELVISNGVIKSVISTDNIHIKNIISKIFVWASRNLLYFIGRIALLVPIVSIFVPFGIISIIQSKKCKKLNDATLLIVALFGLHLLISCLWPVFKFRYFVPILPLTIGLGSYGIFVVELKEKTRRTIIILSVVALIVIGIITYIRVPTHTSYYDNNDLYHYRVGEADWQQDERALIDTAENLDKHTDNVIIAPIPLFFYAGRPIVLATGVSNPDILKYFIDKYNINQIVDRVDRVHFYDAFLDLEIYYSNDHYVLLTVKSIQP